MLKILKKAEAEPPKLPEGADRFLWTEVPTAEEAPKKVEYADVLKFTRKEPLDKR